MVRFIIPKDIAKTRPGSLIYIPIWLDLLLERRRFTQSQFRYLHSNMVRFIIQSLPNPLLHFTKFTFQYG